MARRKNSSHMTKSTVAIVCPHNRRIAVSFADRQRRAKPGKTSKNKHRYN